MKGEPVPLAVFSRGLCDESVHYGSIAVVDLEGGLIASVGDSERLTVMRSTAKPFQAMAVVESGATERYRVTESELAIMAGSHSGEPAHTETVRRLLKRAGLAPSDLRTGILPPLDENARRVLARARREPTQLHHNCSGKHAGMLLVCEHSGWDKQTYMRTDHPFQVKILQLISDMSRVPTSRVGVATDGCGVPTFALPLSRLALMFARLRRWTWMVPEEDHFSTVALVSHVMTVHPEMVAGTGRFETDLIAVYGASAGKLVAKDGAEGVFAAGWGPGGWGLAIKIEDGGERAIPVVVMEALSQLGVTAGSDFGNLDHWRRPTVRSAHGEIVGSGRAVFDLKMNG